MFSDSSVMQQEINAIAHLASINASLGKKKVRQAALERMEHLSKSLLKISEELGASQTIGQDSLAKRIGGLDLAVEYPDLSGATRLTAEEVKKVAKSIQKDAYALSITPIRRPKHGIHGPTFLINYHRYSESDDLDFCSFVIKKTDYAEMIPYQIYHEFASCCEQATEKRPFGSPNIAMIDFTAQSYHNPLGHTASLKTNEGTSLLESFSSIARSTHSKLDPLDRDAGGKNTGTEYLRFHYFRALREGYPTTKGSVLF